MNDQELSEYGYELCEFSSNCDFCQEEFPKGELFFHSNGGEYPNDGDYYCRECAIKKIKEENNFYEWFAEHEEEIRKNELNLFSDIADL